MHTHLTNKSTIGRNLILSILLNSIIVGGEITAGIFSNSLALISDALHNFSDLISLNSKSIRGQNVAQESDSE